MFRQPKSVIRAIVPSWYINNLAGIDHDPCKVQAYLLASCNRDHDSLLEIVSCRISSVIIEIARRILSPIVHCVHAIQTDRCYARVCGVEVHEGDIDRMPVHIIPHRIDRDNPQVLARNSSKVTLALHRILLHPWHHERKPGCCDYRDQDEHQCADDYWYAGFVMVHHTHPLIRYLYIFPAYSIYQNRIYVKYIAKTLWIPTLKTG